MLPSTQQAALQFAERLKSSRHNWDDLFERLALIFLPNRQGFTSEYEAGEDLQDHLTTSAPVLARRSLSSAVSVMLRPPGRKWFHGKVRPTYLMQDPTVRAWALETSQVMYEFMYDPRAQMKAHLEMADDDLVTFGNACIRVGWDIRKRHLRFRTRPMHNVYYVCDATGRVVGLVSFEMWTLRQIIDRFGEAALTKNMRKEITQQGTPNYDKEYELVHIVIPVRDAKAFGMKVNKPVSSLWLSRSCREALESKGYDYFPYVCPRWDLSTGELYARSPAMIVLGDATMLQAMSETMIDAGEKVLNPPTWGYGDAIIGQFDLSAGGFTPVEPNYVNNGMAPINPIQLGTLPKEIFEFMVATEERVNQGFFRDVLELPSFDGEKMTAAEIYARQDQFLRQAAPVFSRIEDNYNAPLVNTVYTILSMEGVLPPKPDIVLEAEYQKQDSVLEFEYESPIKLARDKSEFLKTQEGLQMLASSAVAIGGEAALMQLAENFNIDALARGGGRQLDLPEWLFVPMEEMLEARQARQQQQEAMAMAEMANKMAPAAKLIPDAANAGLISGPQDQRLLPAPDGMMPAELEGLI